MKNKVVRYKGHVVRGVGKNYVTSQYFLTCNGLKDPIKVSKLVYDRIYKQLKQ